MSGWVLTSDRPPGTADCYPGTHAVLGWHAELKARMIDHWSNIATNKHYVAWCRLADPPSDALLELGGWKP